MHTIRSCPGKHSKILAVHSRDLHHHNVLDIDDYTLHSAAAPLSAVILAAAIYCSSVITIVSCLLHACLSSLVCPPLQFSNRMHAHWQLCEQRNAVSGNLSLGRGMGVACSCARSLNILSIGRILQHFKSDVIDFWQRKCKLALA